MIEPGLAAQALHDTRRKQDLLADAKAFYRSASKYVSYQRLASAYRLNRYRHKYANQRCFIIGTGPSLNVTDLSLLRNEITFGTNRLYLLFDALGFATTFYLAVDPLVIEHYCQDIDRLLTTKFLPARHRRRFTFDRRTIFFEEARALTFARDPLGGLWDGGSVTYLAIQLAFFMGFDPVYLVGVDHNYSRSKTHEEDKTWVLGTSDGDDRDHFAPDYFAPGVPWFVPNLELKELGYRMGKFAFERDKRRVFDATIGGKLDVFPKVDYGALFQA